MEKSDKCTHCGNYPTIVAYPADGLYYAKCSCENYLPCEFLGVTRNHAIRGWNAAQYSSQTRGFNSSKAKKEGKKHGVR